MGDVSEFIIGQTIELGDGRIAVVRFVGGTQFAPGDWLGVELEDDSGKNNGAVQGHRYFDCATGRGMFVRPSVAVVIAPPASQPLKKHPVPNGSSSKVRPLSTNTAAIAGKRQSILDPTTKRRSVNAGSPTPAPRPTSTIRTLRSPSKSPTKQLSSRPSSIGSAARAMPSPAITKPSLTAASKRTSISARPLQAASTRTVPISGRPSIGAKSTAQARPSVGASRPFAGPVSHLQKQGTARPGTASSQSGRSEQVSPVASQDIDEQSPGSDQDVDDTDPSFKGVSGLTGRTADIRRQSRQIAASSRPATSSTSTLNREMEDLKTKLKVVENKRAEDRERLKNMEKLQSERDKFESIIQKLQAKYQPQQQEIADLRQRIKDAELKLEAAENERVEIDTAMEMATLDREMAEEQAEGYKLELESIRGKCEELELEVEILREENSEFSKEMSPEERTSQGWLHMERNNERLREALLRLRDITQDQEADLRSQIEELQTETTDLAAMRQSLEETKSKLDSSEQLASELKQQLEDAEGADDMVEELTERNMNLTERIDDLKVAVEDLESLKELNDELEQNHIEHEKQLQDDIEEREAQYIELARKSSSQDETITDLEYTISRFRELVTNLQSDLEDMRASQQITEHEATELGSRSKAMMDLNLRLQASASKSQNKAIEMELRRLEAQEAIDHLNIVQCFLPDSYAIDKDSVNAYLRIKRIGFKADLLHSFVRDRANGIAMPGREEDVFAACILMDELVWVSAMCQKFIKFIRGCSLDSFKKIEGALYDLEPVERALNGWVESLKRGDLKEPQCASELKRSIALMSHLAGIHIPDDLQQHAEDVYMRSRLMQSRLENAAVAIYQIKSITQARIILPSDADEDDEATVERFVERADSLVSELRSSKVVASKAVKQLQELLSRSLTLDPSTQSTIEDCEKAVAGFVDACQSSASNVLKAINEEGREDGLTYDDVSRALCTQDSSPFSQLILQSQTINSKMHGLHVLTGTLAQSVEFSSPSSQAPWQMLSHKLKAEANASALHEKEVLRLKDELNEKITTVAMKEKVIGDLNVNVEVLSKRVNDSGGRKEKLKELEIAIEASRSREQESTAKLSSLSMELRELEKEREHWKQASATGIPASSGEAATAAGSIAVSEHTQAELKGLNKEVERTSALVRRLHGAAQRTIEPKSESWLAEPLVRRKMSGNHGRVVQESHEVLNSLLDIVNSPESIIAKFEVPQRSSRLAWRPASDSLAWRVGKQQEQWESWRDWQKSAATSHKRILTRMRRGAEMGAGSADGNATAQIGIKLPRAKVGTPDVRIVEADEWLEAQRRLGAV